MKNKNSPLLILLIILLTCAFLVTSGCSSTEEGEAKEAVSGLEVASGSEGASQTEGNSESNTLRITSYNVCYTKLLRGVWDSFLSSQGRGLSGHLLCREPLRAPVCLP